MLGINDGHNAGAALIRDGRVLAAIQEERLTNVKNFSGVPQRAVEEVLGISDVGPDQVSAVAVVSLNRVYAPLQEEPWRVRAFNRLSTVVHGHSWAKLYVKVLSRFRKMRELNGLLSRLGLAATEVQFIEHHQAHAACAYYASPWVDEPVLVLTSDGAGDGLSATVNVGEKNQIRRVASSTYFDSIGNVLYSEVTGYLGLKRWEHEYKVMGMAPYGDPRYIREKVQRIIRLHPRRPLEFQNRMGAIGRPLARKLHRLFREVRFDNLSAAAQEHLERLIVQWVRNCIAETGARKVACAGGTFLNVKANKLLREMEEVDSVFFYPAADDGGTPVGAALEAYHRLRNLDGTKGERVPLKDIYYGNEFSAESVEVAIRAAGLAAHAQRVSDPDAEVARLVASGKIVARFAGRCEWGPRALGNRSIVADPRDLRIVRKINHAIKHRDFWMPFAASILDSRKSEYLEDARGAPYMIEAFDSTPLAQRDLRAALHPFDLTCRPQTVDDWNPSYRRVLQEFQNLTGCGGMLNTSFNLHGAPIVGTPRIALETLMGSQLDGLALGDWMVMK